MRNIQIVSKTIVTPPYNSPFVFCSADDSSVLAIDRVEDGQTNSTRVIRICPGQSNIIEELYRFSEQEVELLHPLDKTVQAEYVSVTDSLFLATDTGGFYQLVLGSGILEELFIAPSGISAFALSPDSRLLAVATKEDTVSLFTLPDLELITTVELGPQRPEGSEDELYGITIQWRHDSLYFAVNYFDGGVRKIGVYDETGKMYSKSEDGNTFVSKCLAWQPSGGLIASLGMSPSSSPNVTFLELNGLKRADFDPLEGRHKREDATPIEDLLWNCNSDVLALKRKSCVELWVRSNYTWMCKKTIFPETGNKDQEEIPSILFANWDKEIPYRFHLITSVGTYVLYDFSLSFSQGDSNGSALVASINGPFVYSTPFRDCCAPPPTCRFQENVGQCIQEVIVSNFWDGLMCVLITGEIVFFKNAKTSMERVATLDGKCLDVNIRSCYNWTWPNKSQLACISNGNVLTFEVSSKDFLEVIEEKEATLTLKLLSSLSVRAKIMQPIFSAKNSETKFVLVQKRCGALLLQELSVMPNILLGRMPNTVHHLKYFVTEDNITEHSLVVFGLDALTKQLHTLHNNVPLKLINDCNSVDTFQNYLLGTVVQGSLEIIEIKDILDCHKNSAVPSESLTKYSRKVENGSVIVTCCFNTILEPSLTLQIIPRGNLETISPRPLMISSIDVLLKDRKYNEVMLAMRRHRLDFNVLAKQLKSLANHETTATQQQSELIKMLEGFLEDVQDSHTIVLMVTELGETHNDCVQFMKDILQSKVLNGNVDESQRERLVNPYLAVMAKLGLYEEVLTSSLIVINDINRDVVKARIKFLGFYCDNPEILYESALGTYDLNLTSLVADCLNKDPKEYLPILNEYQSLSATKLKFAIDQKLKRYNKAVISLLQQSESSAEEIIKYVERYKVHPAAIKYLTSETVEDKERAVDLLHQVYCSYGNVFEEMKKFTEAAVCYSRGCNVQKCFDCHCKSGNWNAAICCAKSLPADELNELLNKLVKYMEDSKDYEAAGEILEGHLKNELEAFRMYSKGRKWERAYRLATTDDLIKEYSKELESAASALQESVADAQTEINKYILRLRVVKALKEQRAVDGLENDNFSDTESISTTTSIRSGISSSMHSGKTSRSGKNSRKMKRKVYSLKEGSRFEDIAIIAHLWETCQRVQAEFKPNAETLVPALWIDGQDNLARKSVNLFDDLLREATECIKEVWPTVLPQNEFLEMKYFVPPPLWSGSWNRCLIISDELA